MKNKLQLFVGKRVKQASFCESEYKTWPTRFFLLKLLTVFHLTLHLGTVFAIETSSFLCCLFFFIYYLFMCFSFLTLFSCVCVVSLLLLLLLRRRHIQQLQLSAATIFIAHIQEHNHSGGVVIFVFKLKNLKK